MKAMNGIQYKALRTIYKQPLRCSSKILHVKANIPTVEQRIDQLSLNYYDRAIKNSNPLINNLNKNLINSTGLRITQLERINTLRFS